MCRNHHAELGNWCHVCPFTYEVHLAEKGTLGEYVSSSAHYAIGALAFIMFSSIVLASVKWLLALVVLASLLRLCIVAHLQEEQPEEEAEADLAD